MSIGWTMKASSRSMMRRPLVFAFVLVLSLVLVLVVHVESFMGVGTSQIIKMMRKEPQRVVTCEDLENTRKYREDCHGGYEPRLQLLVTGAGGSGTHTTSRLFNYLNLHLSHEFPGRNGSVAWLYAVDSEKMCTLSNVFPNCSGMYPYRFPAHKMDFKFEKVFHQTRCPMANIGAMQVHGPEAWKFLSYLADENLKEQDHLIAAAKGYIIWNEHIEKYADHRFQVEQMNLTDLCLRAGYAEETCYSKKKYEMGEVPQNQREHTIVTLSQLGEMDMEIASKVREMSIKYGYESCMEDCHCNFPPIIPPFVTAEEMGIEE